MSEQSTVQEIVVDEKTAQQIGTLAGGVLSLVGHPELGALAPVAASLIQRLCDAGYTVPALDEFDARLGEFAARADVPTE